MKSFAVVAALMGLAAAAPQGVTSAVSPTGSAPAGCATTYPGSFQVVVTTLSKRDIVEKRQSVNLQVTLSNGVLKDAQGRTGYIASNNQFQFDAPVQAGAIFTAGWSVCANNSIALGSSTVFYQCLSGSFYNLYDNNSAAQCSPVQLNAVSGTTTQAASQQADGQVTAASAKSTVICQISDGQIQQNTCVQSVATITQISDGQIQAPKVTQISDGQVQAPKTTVASTTASGAKISQISDGQVQAPTTTAVSSAKATGATISQISDGQVQAPTGSNSTVTSAKITTAAASASAGTTAPATQTRNAAALPTLKAELFGLAVGVLALAAF